MRGSRDTPELGWADGRRIGITVKFEKFEN